MKKIKARIKEIKMRILPATIFGMILLLAFKGMDVSMASTSPQELENLNPASGAPASKDEKKDGEGEEGEKKEEAETIRIYQDRPAEQESLKYTSAEKNLLTKLADRRRELDQYQTSLNLKASVLESSSKKLDEKIVKLEELKATTEKLLTTYQEQESVKIKSLVKIYESMKPKQAAAIFDKMEMGILLEIIDKMAEKKAALVLAQMSPEKAKEITQEIANDHSLASEMGVKPGSADKVVN